MTIKIKVPYRDIDLVRLGLDPDHLSVENPEITNICEPPPETFNEFAKMSFEEFIELKDFGLYLGTTVDGLPHGYGAVLFNKGVNFHPKIIVFQGEKMSMTCVTMNMFTMRECLSTDA